MPCWPPQDPTTPTTAPPTGYASSEDWRRCARSSRTCCWFAAPSSPRSPSSGPSPSPSSAPTPSSPTCSPSSSSPATSSSRSYRRSSASSAHTPCSGRRAGSGWSKLPFVYDKVRLSEEGDQKAKCHRFLSIFEQEGCRMVEMTCTEHDRHAAGSQFITHTIGRVLAQLNLMSTPINTKGYETLLQLTENTVSDSFDLYYGLFMYNVNATEQMDKLDRAFEEVKQMLYGRLHGILRKQIVERVPMPGARSLGTTQARDSLSANREEMKQLSPRVAAVPSPCHTFSPVAFSTATC